MTHLFIFFIECGFCKWEPVGESGTRYCCLLKRELVGARPTRVSGLLFGALARILRMRCAVPPIRSLGLRPVRQMFESQYRTSIVGKAEFACSRDVDNEDRGFVLPELQISKHRILFLLL